MDHPPRPCLAGYTHLSLLSRRPARPARPPPQTLAWASAATAREAGLAPASGQSEWPPGAAANPLHAASCGWNPKETFQEGPLRCTRFFTTPPRCGSVPGPSHPPKPRRPVPPRGGGRGAEAEPEPISGRKEASGPMGAGGPGPRVLG